MERVSLSHVADGTGEDYRIMSDAIRYGHEWLADDPLDLPESIDPACRLHLANDVLALQRPLRRRAKPTNSNVVTDSMQ